MSARAWLVVVVLALLPACAATEAGDGSAGASGTPTASAPPPSPSSEASSEVPATSPSAEPSPTASPLPGERAGRAQAGRAYAVVGVAHDDRLNVRAGPGPEYPTTGSVAPDGSVTATGHDRMVDSGLWIEVRSPELSGWVSYRYLGLFAATDDVTSQVVRDNGGQIPSAPTVTELVQRVAQLRASEDPPSRVTVLRPPSRGDVIEVTVDVIGLGDDSVKGERLVIFVSRTDGGVSLKTVEATLVCHRASDGELCA